MPFEPALCGSAVHFPLYRILVPIRPFRLRLNVTVDGKTPLLGMGLQCKTGMLVASPEPRAGVITPLPIEIA